MPNSTKVTAGKPKIGGSIYLAPAGTQLPTDASTTLAAAFKELGYVSEDGVTNSNSPSSTDVRAWGGDVVMTFQESKEDTFKLKLIESLNEDVLKFIYGSANVVVTAATSSTGKKIAITANAAEPATHVIVVDMILTGSVMKRLVLPNAKLSELGDINYKDNEAVGYDVTIKALPGSSGATHYEYLQEPAPTTGS